MQIKWNTPVNAVRSLNFADLQVNDAFKIATSHARGAVYVKVKERHSDVFYMMELATGHLFDPTTSPVERVNVEVSVAAPRPQI